MVYGRLDVFWPDGKIESFTLGQASISVGRSSGNVITLDTDTISRYHLSLTYEHGVAFLTDLDSVNGTYLDGVKLNSNESYPLSGGEEIQIGHLRMSFHTLDDAPTVPLNRVVEETQRIERESQSFRIDLQLSSVRVTPGAYASVELLIANTSKSTAIYSVDVAGLPPEWVRITRQLIEISGEDDGLVIINIKPQRRSDAVPGTYNAVVRVAPQERPDTPLEAPISVHLQPFSGFGMALSRNNADVGERLNLHLHNQGSASLSLRVNARSQTGNLNFHIAPEQLTLAPGQRAKAAIHITAGRGRWFGGEQRHMVDVQVRSAGLPYFISAIPATVTEKPPLPLWGLVGAGAVVAVIGLILLSTVIGIITRRPQPVIERFNVVGETRTIPRGVPLALAWRTEDARTVELRVNGALQTLNTDAALNGTVTLATDSLDGQVTLSLTVLNGDESATESLIVNVYEPAVIESLQIEPLTLWRDVVQTVTISWSAVGATNAELGGLQNLVGEGYQMPGLEGNQLVLTALPEADVIITLTVTDAGGQHVQETLAVQLLIPTCATLGENTPFYARPEEGARLMLTIAQEETPVVVNGRSTDGAWINAQLAAAQEAWVRRSEVACNGFNVNDLRAIIVAPPTPTLRPPLATVTPPPTATPILTTPTGTP